VNFVITSHFKINVLLKRCFKLWILFANQYRAGFYWIISLNTAQKTLASLLSPVAPQNPLGLKDISTVYQTTSTQHNYIKVPLPLVAYSSIINIIPFIVWCISVSLLFYLLNILTAIFYHVRLLQSCSSIEVGKLAVEVCNLDLMWNYEICAANKHFEVRFRCKVYLTTSKRIF